MQHELLGSFHKLRLYGLSRCQGIRRAVVVSEVAQQSSLDSAFFVISVQKYSAHCCRQCPCAGRARLRSDLLERERLWPDGRVVASPGQSWNDHGSLERRQNVAIDSKNERLNSIFHANGRHTFQ